MRMQTALHEYQPTRLGEVLEQMQQYSDAPDGHCSTADVGSGAPAKREEKVDDTHDH